jgi:hypothetical protein
MNRLHPGLVLLAVAIMLCALAGGVPATRAGDAGLTGAVTSMATGAPIAGVRVGAEGRWAATDANGRYTLSLPPGTHDVRAEAPGYIGMTERYRRVSEGGASQLDLQMIPSDPSPEEAQAIEARMLAASAELAQSQDDEPPLLLEPDLLDVSRAPDAIRVLMPDGYAVVMAMDEYLKGVVPHEMPAFWPTEALKAQAVAARSYAATAHRHASDDPDTDADVCTTTHCQVWSPTHYDTTDQAVEATSGVVVTYDGKVIQAFFHAHCDGHTRDVEAVWGSYLPYLRSVPCPCGFSTAYGHGVGMCQWGAKALAEQGRSYQEILQHYYTGINVTGPAAGRVTGGSVQPAQGDTTTTFTFEAAYACDRSELPAAAHVIVSGRSYALQRTSAKGVCPQAFRLTTRLPAGSHTVRLYFDDGRGTVSTYDLPNVVVQPAGSTPAPGPDDAPTDAIIVHSTDADWAGGAFDGVWADSTVGDGALVLDAGRSGGAYTSEVITAPLTFVALGAWWHAPAPSGASVSWEVRTRAEGASWGPWTALTIEEDDGRARTTVGAEPIFGAASALQYRVTLQVSTAGISPVVENVSWACIDTREGPTAQELPAAGLSEGPDVISRAAWGADESLMTRPPEYRTVRAFIVHHTVTDDGDVDPAAIVRAIYRYHAIYREKGDIGYNYLIDHLGHIYEGRYGGPRVVGSHAGIFDYGSVGIALIGDHQTTPVPEAAVASLARLLAWRCADYRIDPGSQGYFVTRVLPAIMGHRDCCATACPGDAAYSLLSSLRSRALAEMANVPPQITLAAPGPDAPLRGVAAIQVQASSVVTRLDVYIDGAWVESTDVTPTLWSAAGRWNTTGVTDGAHQLRVVASNAGGQGEASGTVTVDNIPPANVWASAPPWNHSPRVSFLLSAADAAAVQFSNGWIWEGEALQAQVGRVISDSTAYGGQALRGTPEDGAGAWYGPYTCVLPPGKSYQAAFRLETPSRAVPGELALLDVSDSQGLRVYTERPLTAADFSREGAYEEFSVPFAYPDDGTTCAGDALDGLEFRTWYRGNGELYLDRVTVWGAPQPITTTLSWDVRPQQGSQAVTVRFLDAAGNAADCDVTVRIDSAAPAWLQRGDTWADVRDPVSGLDPASAAYAASQDEGLTWGEWHPLTLTVPLGITTTVRLEAPTDAGPLARFRIDDVAGNTSWSDGARILLPVVARHSY